MPVPIRRLPFLPLALVLAAACGAPAPASAPTTGAASGTLFIVGGGTQPPAMVARFVELAGGAGRARIAVLPMASEAAAESGAEKAEQLRRLGADAFVLNVTRAQAQGDSAAALLRNATGIWFGGGDQARLTAAIRGTPVMTAIRERWRAGAVVGGTSAGAAVMSDSMMTGNQRKAGEDTIGYHGDEYPRIVRGSIEIVPGFGFLPGAVVDQHFLRRERHNRLLSVVLERPALLGVGIDESTALLVHGDGRWTVEGESAVLVVDARAARVSDREAPLLGAAEVRLHLLPAGSAFDPRTGRAALPPGR